MNAFTICQVPNLKMRNIKLKKIPKKKIFKRNIENYRQIVFVTYKRTYLNTNKNYVVCRQILFIFIKKNMK